jgi:tRNA dimethylallyltransferase
MAAEPLALKLPLIVIVGPTASGKTSLAVDLAKRFNGEIICADSRTVYKGMNIGTAKPTLDEQAGVPHWGLDLVTPGERFTAADFKTYAIEKIAEIRARGHVPFLVGGTGLYVDTVVFDYQFGGSVNPDLRAELSRWTTAELHDYCHKHNITLPENSLNKRYIIRAIEQNNASTKGNAKPAATTIIVGIATDKETLRTRIADRIEQLFDDGVVEEAILLGKKYGWEGEAMTGNVYRLAKSYVDKEITLDEYKEKLRILDWRLAKRQLTWLRRNKHITWLALSEADKYLARLLAKVS